MRHRLNLGHTIPAKARKTEREYLNECWPAQDQWSSPGRFSARPIPGQEAHVSAAAPEMLQNAGTYNRSLLSGYIHVLDAARHDYQLWARTMVR